MPRVRRTAAAALIIIARCLAATPAHAQTAVTVTTEDSRSIAEVVVGMSAQSSGVGLAVAAGLFPTSTIGVIGELSGHDYRSSSCSFGCSSSDDYTHGALLGFRVRTPALEDRSSGRMSHWRPFAQALAGSQWGGTTGPARLAVQPGIGVDTYLPLPNTVIVHIEYDYRLIPDDHRHLSAGRFFIGIGAGFGTI